MHRPKRVPIQIRITTEEAPWLLRALYCRDRKEVAQDAAFGRDPFAVTHGLQNGTIKYMQRDPQERWKSRQEVLEDGGGDCEDLATAVTAELNEALYRPGFGVVFAGQPAPLPGPLPGPKHDLHDAWAPGGEATVAIYKPRQGLFHVLVWTPTWGLVDPSVAGGMGQKKLLRQG